MSCQAAWKGSLEQGSIGGSDWLVAPGRKWLLVTGMSAVSLALTDWRESSNSEKLNISA
jgi:hypothetical protein